MNCPEWNNSEHRGQRHITFFLLHAMLLLMQPAFVFTFKRNIAVLIKTKVNVS